MTPVKPLLLYDGECAFCRMWIARWRRVLGDRVVIAPYQEPPPDAPPIPREALARAIHLIEPDGRASLGAEAVFRALAYARGRGWLRWTYRHVPGLAQVSEACYAWVATHRPLCERVTRALWGAHLVPAGERLTTWLFLRGLGVVFLIAFVSLWTQVIGLAGAEGILPARAFLDSVRERYGAERYWLLPTLAWLGAGNDALHLLCALGTVCSLLLTVGLIPAPSLLGCWALYLSLVTAGQQFFWFQWDALLLETGFLALFIAPLVWHSRPGSDPAPSRLALWALRALLFRLMVSSAAVKLASGDPTWRALTALEYHYETQCLPPWTAWYAHHLPAGLQRLSAIAMFAIEGLMPFLLIAPRRVRVASVGLVAGLQLVIAFTGNYGFFNLLTLVLCVPWLDDGVWPRGWRTPRVATLERRGEARGRWPAWLLRPVLTLLLILSLVPLFGALDWPTGWLGPAPALYRFVSPLRTVSRYGLFSVMTTRRPEIVLAGSADGKVWHEYTFRWKPGELTRRPEFVAPHQPRLDWQMWFAALGDYRSEPWFLAFCQRLLEGSPAVKALMSRDPFPEAPPRYLRALVYDYHFTSAGERRASGAWWRRDLQGLYCPVLTLAGGRLEAVAPAPPDRP